MNQKSTAEIHLDRWERSGLTQVEYCRKNKVNPGTFAYWKNKHGKKMILSREENPLMEIFPEVCGAGEPAIEIRIYSSGLYGYEKIMERACRPCRRRHGI